MLTLSVVEGDRVEFRVGRHVAYGWVEIEAGDLVSSGVDHAPTQEDLDAVAAALDQMDDDVLVDLYARAGALK